MIALYCVICKLFREKYPIMKWKKFLMSERAFLWAEYLWQI